MRRQLAVALVVGLALWAGGGAGAQTTTSSSSPTSSTALVTTSTSSTTSTTAVNPCTGQPCTVDPPVATLAGSGGEVRLDPLGFCWREIGGQLTHCRSAALALDIPVGLVVRTGETLTLRFAAPMAPTKVVLQRADQPGVASTALTPANPTVFVADLPVGVYAINFQTLWNQGDVGYRLKIDVRAPATASDPRSLALTG
jgi:hypothetical protein